MQQGPQESAVAREVNLKHDGGGSETFATPLEFPEEQNSVGEGAGNTTSEYRLAGGWNHRKGEGKVTDVNHCIEEIGFGRYQWKVILVMGMMSFSGACEIWLSTIVISKCIFKC